MYYRSDRGLTNTTQLMPLCTADIDASWMKANSTEYTKAGNIINAKKYQEFIPYQTKFETAKTNSWGLKTQNDQYDPWTGTEDNEWADAESFPANFRGEYNIDLWYETQDQIPSGQFIYQWKTDIFGNQYALLKENIEGLYDRKMATGALWTRDQFNKILPAIDSLSAIYDNFTFLSPSICADIINDEIKDFDVWFDTLMLQTPNYILIEKIKYDYDTNYTYSIADDVRTINLSSDMGNKLAGTWLFDENKQVTLCILISSGSILYPSFYSLNLNTNDLIRKYTNVDIMNQISAVSLTSIEDPVFTYNELSKTFNISFIGYSNLYNGPLLNSINTHYLDDSYAIESVSVITPV
jgi:hypothetical protein